MSMKFKILYWIKLFAALTVLFLFQQSFGQGSFQYNVIPYMTLPVVVFFFLHQALLPCLFLCLFMACLSGAFLSLSVPIMIFLFLLIYAGIFCFKLLFFYKSFFSFYILVLIFSFLFPTFLNWIYFNFTNLSMSFNVSIVLKTISTLIFAGLSSPILKKYLQTVRKF